MSPSAMVCLIDMFLIVFGQHWKSIAQWNKLHQALAMQTVLLNRISLVLVFSLDLLSVRKIEYHQTYPLNEYKTLCR